MALGRVGTEAAVAALSGVLLSTHTPVELQVEVVRALAWIGSGFALQSIQSCLTSTSSRSASEQEQLQREVIAVLGRVESLTGRTIAVKLLLDLLHTAHPISQTSPGKQQIALSLGQLQDANAIDALIHLVMDADLIVRLHAVTALKQLPGAYEALQQRLVELKQAETSCGEEADNSALKQGIETALREWQA
jgi:HEAT repeat protein